MANPLQYILRLIFKKQRANPFEPINMPQVVSTKNKWLYPEDNFGVLERGKAWSKE
jgi:hypothetical protein